MDARVTALLPLATQRRLEQLTPRERVIARHVACGLSSKAIAELECVEPRTVRCQLEMIYTKLSVGSRTQLAVLMLMSGLVEPDVVLGAWREHTPEVLE